jgi:hypothetical protein
LRKGPGASERRNNRFAPEPQSLIPRADYLHHEFCAYFVPSAVNARHERCRTFMLPRLPWRLEQPIGNAEEVRAEIKTACLVSPGQAVVVHPHQGRPTTFVGHFLSSTSYRNRNRSCTGRRCWCSKHAANRGKSGGSSKRCSTGPVRSSTCGSSDGNARGSSARGSNGGGGGSSNRNRKPGQRNRSSARQHRSAQQRRSGQPEQRRSGQPGRRSSGRRNRRSLRSSSSCGSSNDGNARGSSARGSNGDGSSNRKPEHSTREPRYNRNHNQL